MKKINIPAATNVNPNNAPKYKLYRIWNHGMSCQFVEKFSTLEETQAYIDKYCIMSFNGTIYYIQYNGTKYFL